ncbi:MAG: hypothetical protein WCL50_07500, partial [Spirochaetota bacterium]
MDIRIAGPEVAPATTGTLVRIGSLGERERPPDPRRSLVVADPEVWRLHGSSLPGASVVTVPRGELAKNLEVLETLYEAFLEKGLDRSSSVIAFGGGATCDLVGFAAATWLRGIAAHYIPTSLLA